MTYARTICATPLIGCLVWFSAGPAMAQTEQERVPLIMLKSPSTASFGRHRLRSLYAAMKKRAGKATRQVLTLTKTEVWSVPKQNVGAVKKAAPAWRGHEPAWFDLEPCFPAGAGRREMNDKQKAHYGAGHCLQGNPGCRHDGGRLLPPMVEYALTKDAKRPAPQRGAKITVELDDKTVLTITRTSVDIKSDMCIWRGTVDGTVRRHPHVVAGRDDGRHGSARGAHLFDQAHGRRDACRRRDGRGSHAAGARADAGALAQQ